MKFRALLAGLVLAVVSVPVSAETARQILTSAAYASSSKATALVQVGKALASADAALDRNPADKEAKLQRALAISYRGKLTRNRSDVLAARREFEAMAASDPRNAEAQMAVAGWHLGAIIELGPLMARSVLGARSSTGLGALGRSLALGGDRASILALASLHRILLDPADVKDARGLAEAAVKLDATTPFDRVMQKQAELLLVPLRKGDGKAAARKAEALLPFGRL